MLFRRLCFLIIAAIVGCYYLWGVRAAGYGFVWGHDLGGYYDYLGRAFAHGHLYLPITPAPELLALANPWKPAAGVDYEPYKMYDMALFHGRYYLYHGAAPALFLFTPWRLAAGHDLPENFALFLLCFGGFLFSCGALLEILDLAGAKPGPLLLSAMLLALGTCQSVPYLLNRVYVYEIAIGGGYFCISAAVFFLTRGISSNLNLLYYSASGIFFGLAIACRPHLALIGLAAPAALLFLRKRAAVLSFLVPFVLAGAAIAAYNYLRFGNPLEFGISYLLAGPNQNRIRLEMGNVIPGLYYFLFCPPDFGPVFPWVRLVFRNVFSSPNYAFPPGYFIEPTVGVLWLSPVVVAALLSVFTRVRLLLMTIMASSAAVLLFLAATGFTTERYEVDFLPLAVLCALASAGILLPHATGWKRTVATALLAVSIACSMVANLALGISGPYNEMLKNRPATYVHIARWLSPIEKFRPVLNPPLSLEFSTGRHTVTIGERYTLHLEHLPGKVRLVSTCDGSSVAREVEDKSQIRLTFQSGKMTASVNGREALVHDIGTLVAAPAQIKVE